MAYRWPLDVREVAGVPAVPPPSSVRVVNALRRLLARAHDRTALPIQLLLERLLGVLDAPALAALVRLDIAAHLDAPRSAAELAERTGTDPHNVERLLAYLASRGCVRRDRRGRYRANRVTRLLADDDGWRGWTQLLGGEWTMAAHGHLVDAVRNGSDPVVAAHGLDFFAYLDAHKEAAAAFHDAQAAGARLQAVMCAPMLPLEHVRSVLDVGGGTGTLLSHVLASHRELRGSLLDLTPAEAGARATFRAAGVSDRAEFVAGNFFDAVPRGHDLHLLTAIVHDWDDDDCVRILQHCANALNPDGKICVVESELRPGERNAFVQSTDALMMSFTRGGRERTAEEFDALWRRVGLECTERKGLPSGATLFVLESAGAGSS